MAVEIFLELPDVEGESLKSGFEGKIDILQYSWASSQSATRHSGTGGGSGRCGRIFLRDPFRSDLCTQ